MRKGVIYLLTNEDKNKITDWISINSSDCPESKINIKAIEDNWAIAKSNYLFDFMGRKLIQEIPCVGYEYIDPHLFDLDLINLRRNIFAYVYSKDYDSFSYRILTDIVYHIFSPIVFINNHISERFDLGEFYWHKNEKWTKAVDKLFRLLNIPLNSQEYRDCEVLQNKYSIFKQQIAQTPYTLKLSIHPLDYLTMSDNNCNWDSCMSWAYKGEYHAGTIEMCNSPSVIVAYVEGGDPLTCNWPSKQWRELFIINEDFISSVHPYPYYCKSYEDEAFKAIRALAKKNLGWEYSEEPFENNSDIDLDIGFMYNDIFHKRTNTLYLRNGLTQLNSKTYAFSGPAICSICGKEYINRAETHICDECGYEYDENYAGHCADCGTIIYNSDDFAVSEFQDIYYCQSCADYHGHCCEECGEWHLDEDMHTVSYIYSEDTIEENYVCHYCFKEGIKNKTIIENEKGEYEINASERIY